MKSIKIFSKSQFSVLWWSGTLSSFGDWATLFASVALASYLGSEGGNSELTAVIPIVARIIPALMSSFAGILADRFNKKNVMIICDLSRMVIVLGLFFTTTLIQLFLINFLSEIFSLIRQPSRESVVPEVVDNEYLVKANSLFTVGTYASLPLASLAFGVISDNSLIEGIVSYGNGWNGSVIFVITRLSFRANMRSAMPNAFRVANFPLLSTKPLSMLFMASVRVGMFSGPNCSSGVDAGGSIRRTASPAIALVSFMEVKPSSSRTCSSWVPVATLPCQP